MKLTSESFTDQGTIPERNAFGKIDGQNHVALAGNANPHLAWSDAPDGTQSFAIICHDPDVPSKPDDVNQEDREIPGTLPRVDFYHWALIDIPAGVSQIAEAAYSDGITPRGKAGPLALDGTRQGVNDFTTWFAADRDMNGDYFGYDGPCPPWNDSIAHRYVFTVYALDIAELPFEGRFTGGDVIKAIQGHILAQASITGLYTLNPRLAGKR
ncbi:YbhB/YbcL family Raf kinase inhibitor-like protein [Pollutimonas sp. M17]|uniref:YbhB/YbcL family Raf kinase inhibitor-like protein n=1 Tax=Pollutimonas sp. M17 TaxID=2962065 RepID=UPI0021F40C44|nr:YbhB/YbcL family Raf kinase inhibitor-like protein [Pollutimonas sp. M17]UYO94312.1 YbhB/YbcL family Raf kinase inhibitor-like protein [Pollutimonas sp. M17]HWK71158.1 YbhB/YbcL family Raf kinase inhibitor-like protein [Burkholderiaceae bacterium]